MNGQRRPLLKQQKETLQLHTTPQQTTAPPTARDSKGETNKNRDKGPHKTHKPLKHMRQRQQQETTKRRQKKSQQETRHKKREAHTKTTTAKTGTHKHTTTTTKFLALFIRATKTTQETTVNTHTHTQAHTLAYHQIHAYIH